MEGPMLTRLKVTGFKNLVDVEVRFGPFTCVGGANGVGKSNLLDAITFLSALADSHLAEAAMRVRDQDSPSADIGSIFHRFGKSQDLTMSFEADMIIPAEGTDDLGQEAIATTTFVRYSLSLRLTNGDKKGNLPIEIVSEELTHIRAGEFKKALGFKADKRWLSTAIHGRRSAPYYISTSLKDGMISVHQDNGPGKGKGGKTRRLAASRLPRTVLSSANAIENPTATLVRQEMRSWRLLQLEPSALRRPDNFTAPTTMDAKGSHLPATLWSLAHNGEQGGEKSNESQIYATAAGRLAELLNDVRDLKVDRDEKRDTLTLMVAGKDGTFHPARSLSDGTLRFLALAVLELDPKAQGVICLEEPENGIHPARIPAILALLQDIAVDTEQEISPENPLRQVIINTHSPAVVMEVPEDTLLIAETVRVRISSKESYDKVIFSAIAKTWRQSLGVSVVPKGNLLSYLNPIRRSDFSPGQLRLSQAVNRRVVDDPEFQLMLFGQPA
jgi:predicted ATPase